MNAQVKMVTLGGTIRLTARRSDGCTVEISLTEGAERACAVRAVTDGSGRLVSASARSWSLARPEPELALEVRSAIRIAQKARTPGTAS